MAEHLMQRAKFSPQWRSSVRSLTAELMVASVCSASRATLVTVMSVAALQRACVMVAFRAVVV